jgi:ribonucleoside-diphosphate reductase alpha chain
MSYNIKTDPSRDEKLSHFSKATLEDRYLMPEETFQGMFARVAGAFADDEAHAQRLYDYISNLWFMPATPVLTYGMRMYGSPQKAVVLVATGEIYALLAKKCVVTVKHPA